MIRQGRAYRRRVEVKGAYVIRQGRAYRLKGAHVIRRGRLMLATKAFNTIRGGGPRTILLLPYPPAAEDVPRWGHGQASHPGLREVLSRDEATYEEVLREFQAYTGDLFAIPVEEGNPREPNWRNLMLFGLDGVSLYCFTRQRKPRRYIEIGSGNSTLFVDRARRDGGLDMEIISMDPHPRREIDEICDTVLRQPFETVGLDIFGGLQEGDIVFLDSSHRVFMNSDVVAFFLDVLPELPPGILVGIHDVYLPDDYSPGHAANYWSEQYLLACYLIGQPAWLRTVLPCWYVSTHPRLGDLARPLFPEAASRAGNPHGLTFWLQTAPQG